MLTETNICSVKIMLERILIVSNLKIKKMSTLPPTSRVGLLARNRYSASLESVVVYIRSI